MNIANMALLVAAGFMGGMANALAGGASLFTFPALLASGLSPITANASNAFALLPANAMAAWVDAEKIPPRNIVTYSILACAMVGGILGGVLLLETSAGFFQLMVPALIGLATIMFIFGKALQRALAKLLGTGEHPKLCAALIFLSGIYGGYFGAGLGVVLMAVIGATTMWDMRMANAYKNILNVGGNVMANVIFVSMGMIAWHETLIMILGTALGGYMGGRLVKVLPAHLVRLGICWSGVVMTAIYVYRYWL
ncbi:MAG: sulfite exporter TauE/SafE family protein [Pseudomonadota bacterium]|nr:sulfite exporter TauE/SafE family protein [Pseudomonadota bacterium]